MKRIRIKDIAAKAGVSTGTVDRVLHKRGDVSDKARNKVVAAMEELGYEKNLLASTLAYNRTLTISVLLPFPAEDDYWKAMNQGILQAGQSLQHFSVALECVYFDLASPRHFAECANKLLSQPPAAFLFAPVFQLEGLELCRKLQALHIPYVMINTRLAETNALCFVGQDAYQSGFLAGKLVNTQLEAGKTPLVLHLEKAVENASHLLAKAHGFSTYFAQERPDLGPVPIIDIDPFQGADFLLDNWTKLLERHPDIGAVLVTNSRAHLLVDLLHQKGLAIPPVIGFDPISDNLQAMQRGDIQFLINQHPKAQGYLGALTLSDHLLRKGNIPPEKLLPLDIVVRENMAYLGGLDILVGIV